MHAPGSRNACTENPKEPGNSKGLTRERAKDRHDSRDIQQDEVFYMFLHDMKTPLATSRGFLSRFLSNKAGPLTEKQKECLEIIQCNHEEIDSLLMHLFDILRMRKGRPVPDFRTFDIVEMISKIVSTINIEAEQKGMTVSFESANPVYKVYADVMMVTRIVRNLLDNIQRHTIPGGTITVSVTDRDDDVLIQIMDGGNGIPHMSVSYSFNPFYHVRKNRGGTGLGLYVVKQFVELQGGSIWAERIHGKGTSFSFTIRKSQGERPTGPEGRGTGFRYPKQVHDARGSSGYEQDMATKTGEFRCSKCNKLLAKANGEGKIAGYIKCIRCGTMNEI